MDVDWRMRGIVYEIKCKEEGCSKKYIGQTGRTLYERIREHNMYTAYLGFSRSPYFCVFRTCPSVRKNNMTVARIVVRKASLPITVRTKAYLTRPYGLNFTPRLHVHYPRLAIMA